MHILLTNDDGIYALGIEALAKRLRQMGKVTIAAPDVEQSAVSHSITLARPLRVWEVTRDESFFGYGVNGAPADCVKLGISALCQQRPELVVSGINLGANVGVDIFYSGTVAAALEAAFAGIPAIAASVVLGPNADFDVAAEIVCEQISTMPLDHADPLVLNVNVPALPRDEIKGVRLTHQCMKGYADSHVRRTDPRGRDYFWLDGEIRDDQAGRGTDVEALRDGFVSVTPLKHDLTDSQTLAAMRASARNAEEEAK